MKEKDSQWYSKYSLFLQCPKKYEWRYVKEFAPSDQATPDYLLFGTCVHAGIEAYLEGDDGMVAFETYWDAVKKKKVIWKRGDRQWEYHKELGLNFMSKFARGHLKKLKPVLVEERLYGTIGKHKFEGTPDFYGSHKDEVAVVDFKTSAYNYDKERVDMAEQLMAYAHLLVQNGHPMPTKIVYLVFNKGSGSIQTLEKKLTQKQLDDTVKNTKAIITDLAKRKVYPKNLSACMSYGTKCPYFNYCHKGQIWKPKKD